MADSPLSVVAARDDLGRVTNVRFVARGRRVLVHEPGVLRVLDAATLADAFRVEGPSIRVQHVHPSSDLAVLEEGHGQRAGGYAWDVTLWDLAAGARLATLAECDPKDKLLPVVIGTTAIFAVRKAGTTLSLVRFDARGVRVDETPLGDVELPFHLAVSPDERWLAHAYFTGVTHVVDLSRGESGKLAGGALRIGRQHDKGLHYLAFDSTSTRLAYAAGGAERAHVWSVESRKSQKGGWEAVSVTDARFVGSHLVTLSGGARMRSFAPNGSEVALPEGVGDARLVPLGDDRVVLVARSGVAGSAGRGMAVIDVASGREVVRSSEERWGRAVLAYDAVHGAAGQRLVLADAARGVTVLAIDG